MRRAALFLVIGILITALTCNKETRRLPRKGQPTNIILLIGDGMGLAQVSTAYYYQDETPSFSRFQHIGLHKNNATDAKVTDSASGATAFSTGYKTFNKAIGVGPDSLSQRTILEIAAGYGLKTGVVATSSIVHATPASFYAHVNSRHEYEEIASQLVTAPVDFFAGGGTDFFVRRKDGRDLLAALRDAGYQVDTTSLPTTVAADQRHGFLLAPDGMPKMQEGRGDFLPQATKLALDYLAQGEEGFFLMVEGSQIDWGGHANDAEYIIEEVKDFDKTIKAALDFADQHGNTLVVVTADHETGGLSLSSAKVFGRDDYRELGPTFSTGGHSASLIPVFAYGPGAHFFQGVYENNEIFGKMREAAGW